MFRKLSVLALVIIALHIAAVLALGGSWTGSLVGNLLQIVSCGLAVAASIVASRRAMGLSRRFWLLVASGLAIWGVANVGWMYYEIVLRAEPPTGSLVRFLFGTQSIFFALAVFLNQEKDTSALDLESVLDFIQIAIVFFFIFLGFYYIPSHHLDARSAYIREVWMETGEDVGLVLLAGAQAIRARSNQIRKLYQGFAVYLLAYTVCAGVTDYMQTIRTMPTGTWYDLGWTVPLLGAALWAANWQASPPTIVAQRTRQKRFGELLLDNSTLALAPLIVLLQVAQLGKGWHALRFTLLGVSIVCYAARLGVTQYRQSQAEDTLERHNRAMDSAVNGIAIVDVKGQYSYANAAFAQMMGRDTAESIVGRPWRDVYAPQDVASVEEDIRDSLRKSGKWQGPVNIHRHDGSTLPVEMAITGLPDGGVVCVSRDMTAKRVRKRRPSTACWSSKWRRSATLPSWECTENGSTSAPRWRRCLDFRPKSGLQIRGRGRSTCIRKIITWWKPRRTRASGGSVFRRSIESFAKTAA
jgi:PAS domain S-box-containing protein